MNWSVFMRSKHDKEEECIAMCLFGDDAEMLLRYHKDNGAVSGRIAFSGLFGEETHMEFTNEVKP